MMIASMKRVLILVAFPVVLIGVIGVSQRVQGVDEMRAEEAARELISVSGIEDQLVPLMKQMFMMQAQAAEVAGVEFDTTTLDRWVDENITWSDFEPGYIEIYTDLFTTAELVELAAFQRSAIGRKSMELMPVMMERGGQLGMQILQDKLPALMELIDEAEALEEEG